MVAVLDYAKNCVQVFDFHVWLKLETLLAKCDSIIGKNISVSA